jgi:hypothetical protein
MKFWQGWLGFVSFVDLLFREDTTTVPVILQISMPFGNTFGVIVVRDRRFTVPICLPSCPGTDLLAELSRVF